MKHFVALRTTFPDPELAHEGLVDMSDDLSVERLLEAYSFGIFPWPQGDLPTLWFSPEQRGVIDFDEFHLPKSLAKLRAQSPFQLTFDRAFEEVVLQCAIQPRPGQDGTWITEKLARAYTDFHRAGYAHSVEAWDGDELVGGLYGVYAAGSFSGESMFFKKPNASKLALVHVVEFLRSQGLKWMDIQMVTPLSKAFGGKYLSRHQFLKRLTLAKLSARPIRWPS